MIVVVGILAFICGALVGGWIMNARTPVQSVTVYEQPSLTPETPSGVNVYQTVSEFKQMFDLPRRGDTDER